MDLSIIIPCFNEIGNLELLLKSIEDTFGCVSAIGGGVDDVIEANAIEKNSQAISYELVFVNDGSSDGTSKYLAGVNLPPSCSRCVLVDFSRNFGKEAALFAGLEHSDADYVAFMDSDMQQPPSVLLDMYKMLLANPEADCVAAFQEQRKENAVLNFFKRCFYKFFNRVANIELVPNASDFRVFKREVASALVSMPEYFRFTKGMFSWVGFNTLPYPYTPAPRASGETKWSFRKLWRYGIDGMLSFTTFPLKIASIVGSLAALIGVILVIVVIVEFFITSTMPSGYPTVVCLILIFGGMILGALGVIGEYIARIYIETKRRPMYIAKSVKTLLGSDSGSDGEDVRN